MLLFLTKQANTQELGDAVAAFPGAEGFGKYASGGRGGLVYIVTNLNDSGTGSLRWAVESKGPRIIVFAVSGNIELRRPLSVADGNLTIAGQSAPGDGITIQNFPFRVLGKSNIIIRFIRFRLGDLAVGDFDSFEAKDGSNNLMIDHCSFSWGIDETFSLYNVSTATVQNCIIAEGLNDSRHSKGKHGFGSLIGGNGVSLQNNLWSGFWIRNPAISSSGTRGIIDIRNNVFFNWGMRATDNGPESSVNLVANYYKPGPATILRGGRTPLNFLWPTSNNSDPKTYGKFYLEGNVLEGRPEITLNQWQGVRLENSEKTNLYLDVCKNTDDKGYHIPFTLPSYIIEKTKSAIEAYEYVVLNAGSSLQRDSIDARIIGELVSGKPKFKGSKTGLPGIIDSQRDVGGWPELQSLPPPKDTDRDGMPDSWEIEKGLNPERRDDRFFDLDPNYTNLEVYLNSLVAHLMES